ncbi:putative protein phosphatase 2C-like protein 45 [Carex rostrata]
MRLYTSLNFNRNPDFETVICKATCVTKPTLKQEQVVQKRVEQRPIAKKSNVAKAPPPALTSRGIRDSHFKQWIIPEPETQTIQIGSKSEFVILASYGLWDKITNQEAVSTVHPFFTENHKTGSIVPSCKKLVELSILKGIGG